MVCMMRRVEINRMKARNMMNKWKDESNNLLNALKKFDADDNYS